ncbi:hypothetical protein HBI56_202550 [Parastagonospora nodorum]|uniref:Uncharacterized protein n=2 Tax=Phaeosphaeria nodorum (strain SN15 / ATCC MYA-4574 / FGSC 10173) TaxID=321614 RepID=A0A7U2FEK7_PHANO|nr:hypothetical protein SNOG_12139 [Parastagonospora nodorum SN15]KAH3910579.1 hypothetical protein HBH56_143540 [Parastagonospora nodorum]EAT80551.1 hypothetical protein SNOG_12139 [Parastagonospora nodorum SN15]KAH3927571.1 hypothetical protein HBH54_148730 [Parastagonospora nodorum]KAH3948075.1 hypothetical protein HBH53_108780 [Parastagonospora nodorum]KAH3962074.1 hypothetical protein HBH51_178270 [Parastagonospora nodorum]
MQFTTIVATLLSMAVFATAAPVAADVGARQNHGMCVKGTPGAVEQIPDC